jgi:signal transduction histidine kinase
MPLNTPGKKGRFQDKQVVFKVEDNGPAIPPADLPFVFDKFFRGRDRDRSETEGIGLGLAICKSIIDKYGGHIWAESQLDQGCAFTFTLPLASVNGSNCVTTPALNAEALPA